MVPTLEVALLGPLELRIDGETATLPGLPQRVLVARLALAPGRTVPVSDLVDALWPGNAPQNAIGNLHSYVSRLRRVVGGDGLTREPAGYRLHIEPDQTDVGRVARLVAQARSATVDDPPLAASLLAKALSMWRGEPLSDLGDPIAFASERARLAELRRQLLEECFDLRLAVGAAADVLPELEREVTTSPNNERLHLSLMLALHRDGRTAEALRVADSFRRRMAEETGLWPSPALADLERRMLAGDPALQPSSGTSSSPRVAPRRWSPADRFVGRDRQLAEVRAAIGSNRVVTVVGPGGVGKTRLVLELLDRLDDPGAVHLVELAEVPDEGDVCAAVAASLGLNVAASDMTAAIAERLAKTASLLVLDNCEHVLRPTSTVVGDLVQRVHDLRVLATSRQRLDVRGERVIRLGPLEREEQVDLFCDRASLLRAGFDRSGAQSDVVAEICRLVDGLPLAVELSARREAVFGLAQLRDHLSAGLDILEPVPDGDRSTAVTATVEWSYRLLDPDGRAMFDRLAVCRGGVVLDALPYLAPTAVPKPEALLADLVEASLVVPDLTAVPPRYRLLETMRAVALGHMEPDQLEEARAAHAAWMQAHAGAVYRSQGEQSAETALLVRREVVNLRDALAWLVESHRWEEAALLGAHLAPAMAHAHHIDLLAELRRLEAGLSAPGPTAGLCAIAAGAAAWVGGEAPVAERLFTTALARLPADHPQRWQASYFRMVNRMFTGEKEGLEADANVLLAHAAAPSWAKATAVCCAALINLYLGDAEAARAWMVAYDELLAEIGRSEGFISFVRGELLATEDPLAALACYEQAERLCHAHGHVYDRQVARIGRLAVLIRLGRPEAVPWCRDVIDALEHVGMWTQMWTVLRLTAELLAALGDPEPAASLLAAADADALAPVVVGPELVRYRSLQSRLAEELGPDRLARVTTMGKAGGRTAAVGAAMEALARHG